MAAQSVPGGYILTIRTRRNVKVRIGALGKFTMRNGVYYYGGSARRGIGSRIQRHAERTKLHHWHIDYLTTHPDIQVPEAWCYPGQFDTEHRLQHMSQVELGDILPGFGAGDCTHGCRSHLWYETDKLFPEDISADYYIVQLL